MTITAVKGNLYVIPGAIHEYLLKKSTAGDETIDEIAVYKLFRKDFGDHYDFVRVIVSDPRIYPGGTQIYNNVQGIGMSFINERSKFGTNKLLRTLFNCTISPPHIRTPPTGLSFEELMHQLGHTWCFYVGKKAPEESSLRLLHEECIGPYHIKTKWDHWGTWPDDANSCMNVDSAEWIKAGKDEFYRIIHDSYEGDNDWFGFHPLDLYLMGLIPSSEVPKIAIVQNPEPPIRNDYRGPFKANPCIKYVEIGEVTNYHGNRKPDYLHSQRIFHEAWILMGTGFTEDVINQLDEWRESYSNHIRKVTGGRMVVDTSLLRAKTFSQEDYSELYFRDSLSGDKYGKDNERFWSSPDLWVRHKDEGNNPNPVHEEPKRREDSWLYARLNNAGSSPYENVTVNVYLADRKRPEIEKSEYFLYPVDWNPKNLIESVTNIRAMPGDTIIKIKLKPGTVSRAEAPSLLAEIIPMEVEPSGLHRVFENRKLAQRNLYIRNSPKKRFQIFLMVVVITHGALILTPRGFFCIKCGVPIDVPGYIGDVPVMILGLGSIFIGIIGLVNETFMAHRATHADENRNILILHESDTTSS